MTRVSGGCAALAVLAIVCGVFPQQERSGRATAEDEPAAPKATAPSLAGSAISALLDANGGKVPATGKELWMALSRLGTFAQLPVVFSAVRLDSGIANPRVVIAPAAVGLSDAPATAPNLNGRLFLAANMEPGPNGDPRVGSVEFISWNATHRRFDFGVIEEMGRGGAPHLRVIDNGRCFSCHKNEGPILGASPWTNATHHAKLRVLVADRLKLVDAVPAGAGAGLRDRIDGMALVAPQAKVVDDAVRMGASFRLNRDTFRLMNASDAGRKAFVALLGVLVQPGPLAAYDARAKVVVDQWGNDRSYARFTADWMVLARTTNVGILADFAPFPKDLYEWHDQKSRPVPTPPPGGFRTAVEAKRFQERVGDVIEANQRVEVKQRENLAEVIRYDQARAAGRHGVPNAAQPSNPRAFVGLVPKLPPNPSGAVNPHMLAGTIGLTGGDRKFLAQALADASAKLAKQKIAVAPAALAKAVFEGPEFADVLATGALPDRDDFKDRFVAGLSAVLTVRHKLADGFAPDRTTYARDPQRDPKAAGKVEPIAAPTNACLRCHEVRSDGKRGADPIPTLAFDPFDEQGRAAWVRTADAKRKHEVLARLKERLHTDADMPPQDAPEHDLFRVKRADAFDDVKRFLDAELKP